MYNRYGKYYVYQLCYPDERVFYVGKGTGERMYAHARMARAKLKACKPWLLDHKEKVIIGIWDTGGDVVYKVVFRSDDEEAVFMEEDKWIRHYGLEHLTNQTYSRGARSTKAKRPTYHKR